MRPSEQTIPDFDAKRATRRAENQAREKHDTEQDRQRARGARGRAAQSSSARWRGIDDVDHGDESQPEGAGAVEQGEGGAGAVCISGSEAVLTGRLSTQT